MLVHLGCVERAPEAGVAGGYLHNVDGGAGQALHMGAAGCQGDLPDPCYIL